MMKREAILYRNPQIPVNVLKGKKWHSGVVSSKHIHPELEFILVISGEIEVVSNDISLTANEGDIIFVNSNVLHSSEFLKNGTCQLLIQFSPPRSVKSQFKYLNEMFKKDTAPGYVFYTDDPDYDRCLSYIYGISKSHKSKDLSDNFYTLSNVYSLLALLYKKKLLPSIDTILNSQQIKKILPTLEYINTHYNESLALQR